MRALLLAAALLLARSIAVLGTTLYVSSYSGTITTLSFTERHGRYALSRSASNTECAPNPSWLTTDANRGELFCLNEGLTAPNGSISSYTIGLDGSLRHVQNTTTISGPVNGVIYGNPSGRRALALAHYTGSAVSSWTLDGDNGRFNFSQRFDFTLPHPGPNPERQDAPHAHEAILDPTGKYILVPDLGADLLRVFGWAEDTLKLTELDPLEATVGSGPRHAVFWNPYGVACEACTTYMYVVAELASTVTGYAVSYKSNGGGLSFNKVFVSSTYGALKQPEGNAPAEVHISPDNRFLVISNRNASSFVLPVDTNSTNNFPQPAYADEGNTTLPKTYPSDSLSTFRFNAADGSLTFVQLAPSGGIWPRQFSINALGNLVAVGLQYDNATVILERDASTGLIGEMVAKVGIEGNVTSVVFGEEKGLGGRLTG